jgi:hypothetical protein
MEPCIERGSPRFTPRATVAGAPRDKMPRDFSDLREILKMTAIAADRQRYRKRSQEKKAEHAHDVTEMCNRHASRQASRNFSR